MITNKGNIAWIPSVDGQGHGWIDLNGDISEITAIHHYDDFGNEVMTFTLENGENVYSHDDGETFMDY